MMEGFLDVDENYFDFSYSRFFLCLVYDNNFFKKKNKK